MLRPFLYLPKAPQKGQAWLMLGYSQPSLKSTTSAFLNFKPKLLS